MMLSVPSPLPTDFAIGISGTADAEELVLLLHPDRTSTNAPNIANTFTRFRMYSPSQLSPNYLTWNSYFESQAISTDDPVGTEASLS